MTLKSKSKLDLIQILMESNDNYKRKYINMKQRVLQLENKLSELENKP